jgi:hypothetical protein
MEKNKQKSSPSLRLKDIPAGVDFKVKLTKGHPIKTGETQYGTWYLWAGKVENAQKVYEGRGKDAKEINNYTGEVIFFPTEKLSEEMEQLTEGNNNVEVSIKKVFVESEKGVYRKYEVTKLSNGSPDTSSTSDLTPSEVNFIEDGKNIVGEGYELNDETIAKMVTDPRYNGLTVERAKELASKIN